MQPHKPDLWEMWRTLATKYSPDESLLAGLYTELTDHYREAHRYYHNLDHIESLLQLYFQYEKELSQPDVVLFSIYYHDVVYTPGKEDNEYQSALIAQKALLQLGVPGATIKVVQGFIEATSNHTLPLDAEGDLRFFIDFDLSILAAQSELYEAYVHNIRKEYNFLSTEQFALGRSAFLQKMLQKEHIFYTGDFQVGEEAARKNMQWELQMNPGIYSAR